MEIEDASKELPGPDGFPLWSPFSFDEAASDPVTSEGAEFEESLTLMAYDVQSRV